MKTKNTLYNSIANLFYYFSTIILGVLNRKAVILFLGIEYQGINGLFSNILSMLSIAELGVGTAIIYCETLTSGKPKKRRLPPSTFLTFILNSANRFRRQLPEPPTQALLTSLGTH